MRKYGKYILAIVMFALGVVVGHAMKAQTRVITNAQVEQVAPFDLMKSAKALPTEVTDPPF
jgi:hypothetical protein